MNKQFRVGHTMQRSALEVLANYGIKGIDAINELLAKTADNDLKAHGLNLIKQIKERT